MPEMKKLERCLLCSGLELARFSTVHKKGVVIELDKCASCGIVFQNPRPSDPDGLYGMDYYSGRQPYAYVRNAAADLPILDARLGALEAELGARNRRRLLDVGCASGDLLLAASRRDWETWGLDVSAAAAELAAGKVKAARIRTGDLLSADLPENYFDAVTLFEVLEHVADPVPFMSKIRRLLAPGGVAVVQTANLNSLRGLTQGGGFYYWEPGHLVYYSAGTLGLLLEKSGLRVAREWIGSELDLGTEMRVFAPYYSRAAVLGKKIFDLCRLGGFTFGTVMVVYARPDGTGEAGL